MRLGILGNPDGYYTRDLLRAAAQCRQSIELFLLNYSSLGVAIQEDPVSPRVLAGEVSQVALQPEVQTNCDVTSCRASDLPNLDALIVRTMPIGSLEQVIFRMDCLQVWMAQQVNVINPPRTLETAIDKWLTLHRLQEAGLPVPPTVTCQTREQAMQAFEQLGGNTLVKPLFGGEGRGIVHVTDPDLAWRVFGTLQQLGQVIYVQQFIEHLGYDIRVLFIGEQYFAIRRRCTAGQWRTNLSTGGKAEAYQISERELEMATRAMRVTGGKIVGVDLLPGRDGRLLVLEVNAVPGWRGVQNVWEVDIAAKVIDYARQA